MKNPKLKLEELRVQSFITEFAKGDDKTMEVQGGFIPKTDPRLCLLTFQGCQSVYIPCDPKLTEVGCI